VILVRGINLCSRWVGCRRAQETSHGSGGEKADVLINPGPGPEPLVRLSPVA
jgi:hypothetical protein